MKINIKHIILALLVIILINEAWKRFLPEDNITDADLKRELYLQKSDMLIKSMKKKLKSNSIRYEAVEENINVDSVNVWNADRHKLDSIRSVVNPS